MSENGKSEKSKKYSELNINIDENSCDYEFEELNDEIDKILNEQKSSGNDRKENDSFEENSSLKTTPTPNPIKHTQTFSYNLSKFKDLNENFFALTGYKNNKFHYLKKNNPQFSLTPIENNNNFDKINYLINNNENNHYLGIYATPKLNSNIIFPMSPGIPRQYYFNKYSNNFHFMQMNNQLNLINNNQFFHPIQSFNNNNFYQGNFNSNNNYNLNNNHNKFFSVNINNVNTNNQKNNDEIMLNNMKNKFKKNHKNNNKSSPIKRKLISQNLQEDEKEHNIIDIDSIIKGKDKRTTLMIKNIPNKYTISTFLDEINIEFKNKYDLFYLPIDYGNKCNLGFAFINFVDSFHIIYFYDLYRGKKWKRFNSEKTCELLYAKIQGKKDLISHFEKGKVLSFDSEDKRPLILPTPNPLPNIVIPIKFYDKFKSIYPYAHFIFINDEKDDRKFIFNSEYLMYEK